jgi:hypothetical protein
LILFAYFGQRITVAKIQTSVFQGSGLDPVSCVVTAADLHSFKQLMARGF